MNALTRKTILAVILALFAWTGTGTAAQAATLVLISLTCNEPEDATWDEPRLVVSTGGGSTRYTLRSMTRGDTVGSNASPIGRVLLGGQANIKLYDLDGGPFDDHDLLGSHNIPNVVTTTRSLTFNWDGAYYILRYRVDP